MTDPIADFLTRIRNGIMAAHETVEIPSQPAQDARWRGSSREQGYIEGFESRRPACPAAPADKILVRLKYTENRTFGDLRPARGCPVPGSGRTSTPSGIPKVLGGMGTAIVSTSRGVMTGHDARRCRSRWRGRRRGLVAKP